MTLTIQKLVSDLSLMMAVRDILISILSQELFANKCHSESTKYSSCKISDVHFFPPVNDLYICVSFQSVTLYMLWVSAGI